jgi:hypothetical protein
MADDYTGLLTTQGRLSVGGSSTGNLELPGDTDAFKVMLTAGQAYKFTLSGSLQGAGSLIYPAASDFILFDSTGNEVAFGRGGGDAYDPGVISFVAGQSGAYYLQVGSAYQFDKYTLGSYTVAAAVQSQPADAYAANASTTGVLTVDNKLRTTFDTPGDIDWFKFHAEQGHTYHFAIGTDPGAVQTEDYLIYRADGSVADMTSYPFQPEASGDYYFAVRSDVAGAYDITMQELQDDYSANEAFPGQLQPGGSASGVIQFQFDTDRFKINLDSGQIYTFEVHGDSALLSALSMSFIDASGHVARSFNAAGGDGVMRVSVVTSSAGEYALDLTSNSHWTGSNGNYTITSLPPVADDYGDTSATAAPLAIGTSLSGSMQWANDVDFFRLDLQAGVTYSITAQLTSGNNGALGSVLMDSAGNTIWNGYRSSAISSFTPTSTGSYYFKTYSTDGSLPAYSVSASLAQDDYAANPAGAGKLAIGGTAQGELEAGGGDRDWFAVDLNAGTTYWFTLQDNRFGGGTLLPGSYNGMLHVVDSKGKVLAATATTYSTSSAPMISFAPTSKGTYYVEVTSPEGALGTYQVNAQIGVRDDVGNDAAHAAALALNHSSSGVLEVVQDKDVFKLSVVAGMTYSLELQRPDLSYASSALSLSGSDASGNYVQLRNINYYSNKVLDYFQASSTGDYYFTVANNREDAPLGVKYTLLATSWGADDFSGDRNTTGVLSPGNRIQGNISFMDDQDWFKVHLDAGRSYVFELQGNRSGGGTLDTVSYGSTVQLYETTGNVISQSASSSGEPRLSYIANTSGDYYLAVMSDGHHTGTYTLGLTQTSTDLTPPQLVSLSAPDGISSPLNGKITLTFNESVRLATGSNSGVTLTDADGNAVRLEMINYSVINAAGQTVTIDPSGNLKPGSSYTLHIPAGAVLDLAGNPAQMATDFHFNTVVPVSSGTDGNDFLIGQGTGQTIDGGAGIDTVYYNGFGSDYIINVVNGHQTTVRALGAATGDTLNNVERLMFSQYDLALDVDGHGGQAYRLYQAAFNRAPDQDGIGYWINALDHGVSLQSVAQSFVASAEFQALYGTSLTDAQYVSQLYHNVLHRDGDAGGAAYWLGVLQQGIGREQVLMSFSESPENQAAVIGIIGHGFAYVPPA